MKTFDSSRFFYQNSGKGIVRTPEELAQEMISKIPEYIFESSTTTFLDPACGRGTFLIQITKKLKSYGHSWENITSRIFGIDIDPFSGIKQAQYILGSKNIIVQDFLEMGFPDNWPKEFNVGLSNPPYSNNLDLKFLNKCTEICRDYVLFVHPSYLYIQQKKLISSNEDLTNKIAPKIEKLSFFNGNSVFGISKKIPVATVLINLSKEKEGFDFEDKINKKISYCQSINELSCFGHDKRFHSFKDKILTYCKENNLHDQSSIADKNFSAEGKFFIDTSHIAGNNSNDDSKLHRNDFFIIVNKPNLGIKRGVPVKYRIQWAFNTREEAENFIDFVKTDFTRGCLALYKTNQHLSRGELRSVPWMDFTQKWTDEKLYKQFSVSKEEQEFIKEIIPPYYD